MAEGDHLQMLRERSYRYLRIIREHEATMLRCAEKLEMQGNQEPGEVARVLRSAAEWKPR